MGDSTRTAGAGLRPLGSKANGGFGLHSPKGLPIRWSPDEVPLIVVAPVVGV